MTNKEIEKEAGALVEYYALGGSPIPAFQIAAMVKRYVSQAYEEALRIGEALERRVDACDESLPSGESLGQVSVIVAEHVGQFRALKDSIALEPVS
jgi:hypothetical protein